MRKIVLALAMCVWAWTADAKQISELQEWSNGTYWVLYDDGSKEQVSEKITLVKASLKELEEIEKSVKDRLLQEMEQNALKTLENGPLKVTYVAPYTKEAVDTKKLKEVMPEIYEKYKKVSKIGASLKITIKN
jgi:predicted phage-related endonuclease